jgi:hypothetical protein
MTSMETVTRAGDRERQATADALGQALGQGYLDVAEYDDRVRLAFVARSTAELRQLLTDLPIHQLRRHDPGRRAAQHAAARLSVRLHLAAYLLMVVIVLTVWLTVALSGGAWYFWPLWPILGAGIGIAAHAIAVRMGLNHTRRHCAAP